MIVGAALRGRPSSKRNHREKGGHGGRPYNNARELQFLIGPLIEVILMS